MRQIKINNKALNKFNQKYPLIHQEDLFLENKSIENESEWVKFVSQSNYFVGYGYLGQQNKGLGWIISFDETKEINKELIKDIMSKAFDKRKHFFKQTETTAFRLFNGEGDGFGGFTIDWYDGYLVISWYNESIYGFKPLLLEAVEETLPNIKGIYEKIRYKTDELPESQFVSGEEASEPLLVKENNVTYATYMNEGLMTGIFLDQEEVRGMLSEGLAENKTVLNMFSYTGAFSVAAVAGGASETTSVDLAKRSLEKTQEQFSVNQMDLDKQRIIVMDVFNYFKYATKKGLSYDVVVLDPPSFARNKKKTFSVAKDYSKLTTEAVEILNKDGVLIASTNAANVPFDKFKKMVEKGINETGRSGRLTKSFRLPQDFVVSQEFKDGNYLKVLVYEID